MCSKGGQDKEISDLKLRSIGLVLINLRGNKYRMAPSNPILVHLMQAKSAFLGDCHDQHGQKNMCVAGALQNFTSQLLHYKEGTSDRRCKLNFYHNSFVAHSVDVAHLPCSLLRRQSNRGPTVPVALHG